MRHKSCSKEFEELEKYIEIYHVIYFYPMQYLASVERRIEALENKR